VRVGPPWVVRVCFAGVVMPFLSCGRSDRPDGGSYFQIIIFQVGPWFGRLLSRKRRSGSRLRDYKRARCRFVTIAITLLADPRRARDE
jgi:hypothetical protein